MRASTTGSLGTANGNLSMITQLNCSPGTSTPCQNEEVANSTQLRRRAELFEQRVARAGSLQQRRILDLERHAVVNQAHLLIAGEQHERAAPAVLQNLDDLCALPPQ